MTQSGTNIGFTAAFLPTTADIASVRELARHGALPPDLPKLKTRLFGASLDLERYDTAIRKLETELSRLTSERSALLSYTKLCRSVLSPINTIPNELLAEIFGFCFPHELYQIADDTTTTNEVDRVSHHHLLQLAQVCSRWNRIAMHTPKLWSTIAVETVLWKRCPLKTDTLIELLESALSRGNIHPLTLRISISTTRICGLVLQSLFRHSKRWKAVDFWSSAGPSGALTSMPSLDLAQLATLYVDVESTWKDIRIFQNAPRLTKLAFTRDPEDLPLLPWGQIEAVTYDSLDTANAIHSMVSLLRMATNALFFEIYLDVRDFEVLHDPSDLRFISPMRDLYIDLISPIDDDTAVAHLFDSLTLPDLESLDLGAAEDTLPPLWSATHFLVLAERSGFESHLTELAIYAVVSDVDLLRCIQVLSQLRKLIITEGPTPFVSDHFLRALSLNCDTVTPLVPNLSTLTLRCALEFTDSVYVDFLVSRARPRVGDGAAFSANLRWLRTCNRQLSSEALETIYQLMRDGGIVFQSGEYVPALHDWV
ncbi:hypothetical protein R3P38DRAFT_3347512 [Favolaschia claudopus]|uniref:F-box domain-containing protein n=1 Tax=Favolaschia claudopus TaxID=2862362 RepID=A0AAW0CTW5_9AGAR